MTAEDDLIPTVGLHRGVPLHDRQDEERLAVVRTDINSVYELQDSLEALKKSAANRSMAPEARLFAAALIRAKFEAAVEERRERPAVDMDWLEAVVACLDLARYRDKNFYDTWLAPRHRPGALDNPIRRPQPLDD